MKLSIGPKVPWFHIHKWEVRFIVGLNTYRECRKCGTRQVTSCGESPSPSIDSKWMCENAIEKS